MRETGSNSLEKKQKREFVRAEIDNQYSMTKICPKCGTTMVYAYGEMYECPKCGDKEYTDFGKIREYLETHGPQNAVTIADATGVSVKTIQISDMEDFVLTVWQSLIKKTRQQFM